MSMDEFVASAQAVFTAAGLRTDIRRGEDLAMCRCEVPDRNIEVVARDRRWTISYMHLTSKKAVRLKGDDVKALEQALRPLCEETAFEPPVGQSRFGNR
jgi:hypothetical protein